MNELNLKYSIHLDNLRIQAKIKKVDFCEDICDVRSYSRYINGESMMSPEKLGLFCEKLGFTPAEFYASYNLQDEDEYHVVSELIHAIVVRDEEKSKKQLISLEHKEIINPLAKKLYDFGVIYYNNSFKKVTSTYAYEQYCKLIDYPNVMSKTYFDVGDIFALHRIAELEASAKDYTALDFLYNLLLDMKFVYVSSHSSYVLPVVYWIVGKLYGIKGDLHKTLKIAHMGINYCHKNSSIKNLGQLYYHVSYTSYLLKDFDESKKYAIKAICAFIANEDDKITQIYLNIMKKDFGVDPLTYVNIKSIDELK